MSSRIELAQSGYQAYAHDDRDVLEDLLAEDFVFSSPADDGIDRQTYFEASEGGDRGGGSSVKASRRRRATLDKSWSGLALIPAHEKSCSPLTIEHRRYHLTTTRIATVLAAGLLLALSAAACGEDVSGQGFALDITEVAVTEVGKTEFENVGVTVPELNCTATAAADATTDADGVATDYSVACTGTTDDGKEVTMDGSTEEGVFVGEVEGEEVFRKDCNDEIC